MNMRPIPQNFSMNGFLSHAIQHAPIYSWVWNAKCSREETDRQLDEMARLGIRAFYIIPEPMAFRPKTMPTELEPNYLTEEYFAQYAYAIQGAKVRGMQCWLYDEGGWPSGGACGKVLAAHPETNKRVLRFTEYTCRKGEVFQYRCRDTIAAFVDGTTQVPLGYVFPEDKTVAEYYSEEQTKFGPMGPGSPDYPDLTREDSTRYFLEVTHEGYRKAIGDTFGEQVFAMFTDEPKAPNPFAFREELMAEYERLYGESVVPYLPLLAGAVDPTEENAHVLRRWYDLCSHKFCDTFLKPCKEWCRGNKLVFTGHMDQDHTPDGCVNGGGSYHLLRALRCLDIPGIDVIWRQIFPGPAQKLSNYMTVGENGFFPRYASSAMEQTGGRYAMTESLGVYGNGVTYPQMRYCMGFQAVRGINIFNLMLISYGRHGFLLAGEQPGFNEAMPYFADLAVFNRYLERLSYIVSIGDRVCDTALYYPVNDFWVRTRCGKLCQVFDALGRELEDRRIDFDVVDDDVFAEAAGIDDGWIRMGRAAYNTVVIPAGAYLPEKTREILTRFTAGGGRVLSSAEGLESPVQMTGDCEQVRVMRRHLANGELLCLFNEHSVTADFRVRVPRGNVYRVDLEEGVLRTCDETADGVRVTLPEGETTAILVTEEVFAPAETPETVGEILPQAYRLRRQKGFTFGKDTLETQTYAEAPVPAELGEWSRYLGEDFSGSAVYETTFLLEEAEKSGGCTVTVEDVRYTCEVLVNGVSVGVKVMPPYRYEVPAALLGRENVLQLRVTNTPGNQYLHTAFFEQFEPWQLSTYIERELMFMEDTASGGLIGPVKIILH